MQYTFVKQRCRVLMKVFRLMHTTEVMTLVTSQKTAKDESDCVDVHLNEWTR